MCIDGPTRGKSEGIPDGPADQLRVRPYGTLTIPLDVPRIFIHTVDRNDEPDGGKWTGCEKADTIGRKRSSRE